jgi:ABC-2 type transport system permease protein
VKQQFRGGGVFRIAITERLAWKYDAFLGVLFSGATVLLAWILWKAIFAGRAELNGFSLGSMTTYYLIASFAGRLDESGEYASELSGEIRSGAFGKSLWRPVDPLRWFLSLCAGRTVFRACLVVVAATLWSLPFASILVAPDPMGVLASLPVLALGLAATALINFVIALLSMVLQDATAIRMIAGILIEFLAGGLVPLALLPGWARSVLAFSPFPALASLPAMLWLGKGMAEVPRACLVTAVWVVVLAVAARAAYRVLGRRYEEVGG